MVVVIGLLLLSLQRYKFESNSQHIRTLNRQYFSCCYRCKDTNLKAIHNRSLAIFQVLFVVAIVAKIQIWKQFTTALTQLWWTTPLLLSLQRYKFESNSQHMTCSSDHVLRCCYRCKDTNLKAIHNRDSPISTTLVVVAIVAKIQIWKQFTTCWQSYCARYKLLLSLQRYKFESNSQHCYTCWAS